MKIKYLVSSALAIGVLAIFSLSSFADTKVNFSLHYTGTSVGNVTYSGKPIDATSKKYYGYCSSSTGSSQVELHVPGAKTYTLTAGQGHTFTRGSSSSGNMTVSATLIHGSSSCGAAAYIEKK